MTFFDCIYLKVSKAYYTAKNGNSGVTGIAVLAMLQMFNLFSIYFIICIYLHEKPRLLSWLAVLIYAILLVIHGSRYYNIDFKTLDENWEKFSGKKRVLLIRLMAFYMVLSVVVGLVLLAFVGGQRN